MSRPFIIHTPETEALRAPRRWADQYEHRATTKQHDITTRLRALVDPTPAEVDAIIGNRSWTRTACDHCGSERVPVAEVGELPDYESSTAMVCRSCLVGALAAMDEGTASDDRAARILGTDHPNAGSLAGDLAVALSEVERLQRRVAELEERIDDMLLEDQVAGEYDYD